MDSTDSTFALERRVRRAYELERARRALFGAAPVLLVAVFAMAASHRPLAALGFGGAALGLGAFALWRGQDIGRGFLPGLGFGLLPLALSLVVSHVHGCGHGGCSSYCVPACAAGGIVAGALVARIGLRRGSGAGYFASSALVALATGAMGCSCVGFSGVLGLGAGLALGMGPALLRRQASV